MNRHYTTAEYEECCRLLREHFDHPAITTDVIVGFPGETEEEFAATKAYLERIHFYEMHIFKYSRRAGTRADRMPDQIPEQVKTVRSDELLALEKKMSLEYRKSPVSYTHRTAHRRLSVSALRACAVRCFCMRWRIRESMFPPVPPAPPIIRGSAAL